MRKRAFRPTFEIFDLRITPSSVTPVASQGIDTISLVNDEGSDGPVTMPTNVPYASDGGNTNPDNGSNADPDDGGDDSPYNDIMNAPPMYS